MAEIIQDRGSLMIKLGKTHTLFVRRDKTIRSHGSVQVSVAVPSILSATIARLINHALIMQQVTSRDGDGRVELTCSGGRELIGVTLQEHEQLAVSVSHLIGFSGRPRFASFANLSVAAFACNRNFATIAYGPGMLVLETRGNTKIHRTGSVVFDPDQLIAWDPRTRFRLDQVNSVSDVYLGRIRLGCSVQKDFLPLILDADADDPRRSINPLWDLMRSVYLPRLH